MDAFSYLSVLLSVILGLAIQQVLQGYRGLVLTRRHVGWYAPPLVWSLLILLMVAQHWWASFSLAGRNDWSFAMFAATLVQTALIYMLAALVLPDVPPDQTTDLKAHYYREAPVFFVIAMSAIGFSIVRELVLNGVLPDGPNLAFHIVFIALSAVGALSKRERVHELLAGVMAMLFLAYVGLLFARL